MLDVSDPTRPRREGRTWTFGAARDMAYLAGKLYLAQGWFGVGVYDISDPTQPQWQDQFWPGGKVRALAARGDILAVGRARGRLALYRPDQDTCHPLAELQTRRHLEHLRFDGRMLWASGRHWLQVYDLADPRAPRLAADIQGDQALWAKRWWAGGINALRTERRSLVLEQVVAD